MNDLEKSGSRTVPIVNAGSGADEHPTQALLDIYTLQRSFQFDSPEDSPGANRFDELREPKGFAGLTKGLAHKTYGFCGDIGRGRTVRSLAMLLALYEDVRLVFIAPDHPTLRMGDDLRQRLIDRNVRIYEVESFEDDLDGRPVIEQLDALYMTRIQKEHNRPEDAEAFDLIVSNPPYVDPSTRAELEPEVRDHEPARALFAPEGRPDHWVQRLIAEALPRLRPGGRLLIELGHDQGPRVLPLARAACATARLHADLAGIARALELRV
jgi:hypothetical protein